MLLGLGGCLLARRRRSDAGRLQRLGPKTMGQRRLGHRHELDPESAKKLAAEGASLSIFQACRFRCGSRRFPRCPDSILCLRKTRSCLLDPNLLSSALPAFPAGRNYRGDSRTDNGRRERPGRGCLARTGAACSECIDSANRHRGPGARRCRYAALRPPLLHLLGPYRLRRSPGSEVPPADFPFPPALPLCPTDGAPGPDCGGSAKRAARRRPGPVGRNSHHDCLATRRGSAAVPSLPSFLSTPRTTRRDSVPRRPM